jgi:hypothetical protein
VRNVSRNVTSCGCGAPRRSCADRPRIGVPAALLEQVVAFAPRPSVRPAVPASSMSRSSMRPSRYGLIWPGGDREGARVLVAVVDELRRLEQFVVMSGCGPSTPSPR